MRGRRRMERLLSGWIGLFGLRGNLFGMNLLRGLLSGIFWLRRWKAGLSGSFRLLRKRRQVGLFAFRRLFLLIGLYRRQTRSLSGLGKLGGFSGLFGLRCKSIGLILLRDSLLKLSGLFGWNDLFGLSGFK